MFFFFICCGYYLSCIMEIEILKTKYKSYKNSSITDLYKHYIAKRENTLIDSISGALALNAIFLSDQIDYESITPQMEEAFSLSFPNMKIPDLADMSSEQLNGVISNWKGKLFEIDVRDKLNNGEIVGDIFLENGQTAIIADKINQTGWDLQILNSDGTIANELQLKATNSLSYVNQAFEKYPDIDIISTNEIALLNDKLINSGISNSEIQTLITEPMQNLFDTATENVVESILPILPFLIIAGTEGRKYFIGRQKFDESISKVFDRGIKTGLSLGVGSLAMYLTDSGLFSIPATILTRIGFEIRSIRKANFSLTDNFKLENRKLALLLEEYKS